MKESPRTATRRKPKSKAVNDAPRADAVVKAAQVSSRRKPPRAA
jgi:hypothetical protein